MCVAVCIISYVCVYVRVRDCMFAHVHLCAFTCMPFLCISLSFSLAGFRSGLFRSPRLVRSTKNFFKKHLRVVYRLPDPDAKSYADAFREFVVRNARFAVSQAANEAGDSVDAMTKHGETIDKDLLNIVYRASRKGISSRSWQRMYSGSFQRYGHL